MTATRSVPGRGALAAVLAAAGLLAAAPPAVARAAEPQAAAARCAAGQLAGRVRQESGAAGTIALSVAIRNVSPVPCTLRGFPRLKLRNDAGPLPTLVRHGGLAILEQPVSTVALAPGGRASLLLAYSNVPTAGQACRRATRLVIVLGGGRGRFTIVFSGAPCGGVLRESPFLAGLRRV